MEPETGQQTNIGTTPTITTDQLEQNQTPVSLPDAPIESFLAPSVEDQQNEQQVQQQQSNVDELLSSIQSSFGNLATQGATQVQLEEQAGIGRMSKELTDVENEIQQKSLAFRREQDRITSQAGLTVGQRNALLADVGRKQNMELADLEVIRQARSNSLTNAQSLIDRKIELQFGDERRRLEGLQFIYNENKDKLTQKQNELLQSKIKKEERAFELAKDKYQTIENVKLGLIQNANVNGAPNGVMSSIMKAKTIEEAYKNAGSFGVSIQDKKARAELNQLLNPTVSSVPSMVFDLKSTDREAFTNARSTLAEVNEMQQILQRNASNLAELESGISDDSRRFLQLRANVVDKLARERTGAVIGRSEKRDFKRILGVGLTGLAIKDIEEINTGLETFKNKHNETIKLIDPTGEVGSWLDTNSTDVITQSIIQQYAGQSSGSSALDSYLNL